LRLWIEREGYQVLEAENGKDAELIQVSTPADLLICDLIMPVKEGIETISLFRRDFPNVGIIAISGGGNIGPDSYLAVAKQLGAWKIFSKPFDFALLIAALHEWKTKQGIT
jgi:CheY-like chemotaxis protein